MLEITTIPAEWLTELSEDDRARIIAEVEHVGSRVNYDEYEDEIED